jgi:hypothetical protein
MGYGFSIFLGLVLSGCGCGVVWTLSYEQEVLQTNMPILKIKKIVLCCVGAFGGGLLYRWPMTQRMSGSNLMLL